MDARQALRNPIRRKIFTSLHDNASPTTFNRICEKVEVRSNDLAYHIKMLLSSGLITKAGSGDSPTYLLSEEGKTIYPYISLIADNFDPLLVIVSIALVDKSTIYVQKKPREPEKGKLIFLGGKVKRGTLIEDAAKAHAEEQAGCDVKDLRLRCINEFMKKDDERLTFHGLIYFFTARPVSTPGDDLIPKKIGSLKPDELLWDNNFFVAEMLENETPIITRTIL
ncbi:MAG: helix-turn-helix domain-containing protein [Nanoarchaeota archaeon]